MIPGNFCRNWVLTSSCRVFIHSHEIWDDCSIYYHHFILPTFIIGMNSSSLQWEFQDPKLEVPTIYVWPKFQGISPEILVHYKVQYKFPLITIIISTKTGSMFQDFAGRDRNQTAARPENGRSPFYAMMALKRVLAAGMCKKLVNPQGYYVCVNT